MEWTPEGLVLVIGSVFAGITGLVVAVRMSKCVKVKCCGGCIEVERDPIQVARQPSDREDASTQTEDDSKGMILV